jgi:hypothetical protein
MKQLKIRFARPEERVILLDWLNANALNRFDPGIMSYPTLQVLCAYGDEPEAYLPVQRALVLESYAPKPNMGIPNPGAIRDLMKASELVADGHGIREIYFIGGEGGMGELAERHGFEKLDVPVYRMRLA